MPQHKYEQLRVKRGSLNYTWEDVLVNKDMDSLDHEEIYCTVAEGISEKRLPASAQYAKTFPAIFS